MKNSVSSYRTKPKQVLCIEDSVFDFQALECSLTKLNNNEFNFKRVQNFSPALLILDTTKVDIIVLDLSVYNKGKLESLRILIHNYPTIPVVILTGCDDHNLAREAISIGAQDYVVKGTYSSTIIYNVLNFAITRQNQRNSNPSLSNLKVYKQKELQQLSLGGITISIYNLVADLAVENNVLLSWHMESEIPGNFLGYHVNLFQTLACLITKSVKHTHDGSVTINVGIVEKTEMNEYCIQFNLKDSGCGIDPKLYPRIRDILQNDAQGNDFHDFRLCKYYVEQMNGTIDIESHPSSGTEITFTAWLYECNSK